MSAVPSARRRLFAPEVIQSSMMDCGPASLKSLLEGYGISVGYGSLREACTTDVDGTSIDTLEDVAVELGLDAEQIMVPIDHILLRESQALPAIVVAQRAHAPAHFMVLWRVHGSLVQVMDPARGRRWLTGASLLREIYRHQMQVPAEGWRAWAESPAFRRPLEHRVKRLGVPSSRASALFERAARDPTWRGFGAIDAATRMLEGLMRDGGVASGSEATRLLERFCEPGADTSHVPDAFWSVRPTAPGDDGEERVLTRGALLVRVGGRSTAARAGPTEAAAKLAPELLVALKEPASSTWAPFVEALRHAGSTMAAVAVAASVAAAATVLAQALLLRSILDLGYWLGIGEHRLGAAGALAVFLLAALLLDVPISLTLMRLGRRLEVLLRVALARKVPRTADAYFHSRPLSDMVERLHSMAIIRDLPLLVGGWVRTALLLVFTAGGILWLAPWLLGWVVATVVAALVLSLLSLSLLQEREMRARSHGAVLVRYYLDALLGISAIRAHGAGTSILREQESILVEWDDANRRLHAAGLVVEALQAVGGVALAIGLVATHVAREGTSGSILLVTYWALTLPSLAQSLAVGARQVPPIRNVLARVLEPLHAPEEASTKEGFDGEIEPDPGSRPAIRDPEPGVEARAVAPDVTRAPPTALLATARGVGVSVTMRDVTVRAGGHTLLEELDLSLDAGSQVAVVGESGAGKSTLLGLLLGWHRPSEGEVTMNGRPLREHDLPFWRRRTAWVDPAVQLHNKRLAQNLLYGSEESFSEIARAIDDTELREVLERLPDGLQTVLGEGGALVSGGEGQRVRLGRAWLRRDVRLVLMDEPFRGLGRDQRQILLARARHHWDGATMICVTHDVTDTLSFPRVLVIEGGRIVEDGDPRVLALDMGSRYHAMLTTEQFLRENLWSSPLWKRVQVEGGKVTTRAERPWVDVGSLVAAELEASPEGSDE